MYKIRKLLQATYKIYGTLPKTHVTDKEVSEFYC